MLCNHCDKNQATMHFCIIENGQKKEYDLCPVCAQQLGLMSFSPFSFSDLFSHTATDLPGEISCSMCGTTLREFKKTGLLGCENCYEDLFVGIEPILRSVQKGTEHVGRTPVGYEAGTLLPKNESVPPTDEVPNPLEALQEEMNRAVQEENFEQAAKLRDEIKKLKEEGAHE